MSTVFKKHLSQLEALQKLKHYCAYQERCHNEVKSKAFDYGLNFVEVNNVIASLIEENYLNEERFAMLFTGGKFRIKQWGRIKIKYELKAKQISPINIKKALTQIDEDSYLKTLEKLYNTYYKKLTGTIQLKKIKTLKHLQARGFEIDLINNISKNY